MAEAKKNRSMRRWTLACSFWNSHLLHSLLIYNDVYRKNFFDSFWNDLVPVNAEYKALIKLITEV